MLCRVQISNLCVAKEIGKLSWAGSECRGEGGRKGGNISVSLRSFLRGEIPYVACVVFVEESLCCANNHK